MELRYLSDWIREKIRVGRGWEPKGILVRELARPSERP